MVPGRQFGLFPTSLLGTDPYLLALWCALHANTDLLTLHGSASRAQLMGDAGIGDTDTYYARRRLLAAVGLVVWHEKAGRATSWTLTEIRHPSDGPSRISGTHPDGNPATPMTEILRGPRRDSVTTLREEERGLRAEQPSATPNDEDQGQPRRTWASLTPQERQAEDDRFYAGDFLAMRPGD